MSKGIGEFQSDILWHLDRASENFGGGVPDCGRAARRVLPMSASSQLATLYVNSA
jgi:hypothetical protein